MKQVIVILSATLLLSQALLLGKPPKEPPPELIQKGSPTEKPVSEPKEKKPSSKEDKKHPPIEVVSLTYGAWYAIGESMSVKDKGAILFNHKELSDNAIVYEGHGFKLPNKGVYMVTFGVTTKGEANCLFQLQLAGKPVLGSKLYIHDDTLTYETATLMVLLAAKGGEHLQLVNASRRQIQLGSQSESIAAYISIVQLQ